MGDCPAAVNAFIGLTKNDDVFEKMFAEAS